MLDLHGHCTRGHFYRKRSSVVYHDVQKIRRLTADDSVKLSPKKYFISDQVNAYRHKNEGNNFKVTKF